MTTTWFFLRSMELVNFRYVKDIFLKIIFSGEKYSSYKLIWSFYFIASFGKLKGQQICLAEALISNLLILEIIITSHNLKPLEINSTFTSEKEALAWMLRMRHNDQCCKKFSPSWYLSSICCGLIGLGSVRLQGRHSGACSSCYNFLKI